MKRTVMGILAHVDAGKTTLSEAILYTVGKLKKLGRVDRKDAFLDNYALERERGITIFSKQAVFEHGSTAFTLVDTPGHVDFSTEMERTLSILDAAVLVISGPDGVQAHTRTLWRLLKMYDIPTFIFVNKMDRDGAVRSEIFKDITAQLGAGIVDLTDGISAETEENIAMCDEELLGKYLESGELAEEDIRDLVGRRLLFPCFFGSALKCGGVQGLLDGLDAYVPVMEAEENFGARVYKIDHDEDGTRVTLMKLTGGSIRVRDYIGEEKITQLRILNGGRYDTCDAACAGMVVAIPGLKNTMPGQGLGFETELPAPELAPVMVYRIVEKDRSRLLKLLPLFKTLEEEDPSLDVMWNDDVKELQIRIMGEIQLEILRRRLHDRFGEDVDFDTGSILYRETIADRVLGVGHFEPLRHYAEVQLLIEPAERGSGISAQSVCSVNDLELNWQRLIMTHIFEKEHRGVLTGSVLTDVNITLVAGKAHLKHTEGGDFRQATYRAIRQGLMKAQSVLLEPWYEIEMELPRKACGRAMTDIDKRFGKVTSQLETGVDDMVRLTCIAPAATMQGYGRELNAYTGGLGSFYCTFYGYNKCHNEAEVIAAKTYSPDADLRNPASSVFCAHGAGFTVEWDEVDRYKHIDWSMETGQIRRDEDFSAYESAVIASGSGREAPSIGTDEIDSILERTFNANKKSSVRKNPYRKSREEVSARRSTYGGRPADGTPGTSGSRSSSNARNLQGRDKYLLVDGYNIIFAWQELNSLAAVNVDAARERLNELMSDYRAMHDINLIIVYDAYRVAGHVTEYLKYNNIGIVFTREAETADKFIERFAHENAVRYDVTVATSDGLEQIIIRGEGCRLMTAADLLAEVRGTKEHIAENWLKPGAGAGTRLGDKMPPGQV